MKRLSTHPELNRIAVKRSLDLPYVVWCILHTHVSSYNHSSHFTKSSVRNISMSFGLNFTKRHWLRILQAGNGVFWGIGYGLVHMRSFARVYKTLADDTAKHVPSPKFIKIKVCKSHVERRAELYLSWFISRGEITIARDTITDLFGLSAPQQRAIEKSLGQRLIVKTNYCHINAQMYAKAPRKLPEHYYTFKHEKYDNNTVYYDDVIAYQMPNTYVPSREYNDTQISANFAPRRALNVSRTLYRQTTRLYQHKRYHLFCDDLSKLDGKPEYIRTYFQGKKTIHRIGHYL